MRDKILAKIANGSLVPKQPRYDIPAHFDPITEEEQQEINFCLNCNKDNCKGICKEFRKFIKELRSKNNEPKN